MEKQCCLIWETAAETFLEPPNGIEIDSNRAGGRYFVTESAISPLLQMGEPMRVLVTSWLVDQRRMGVTRPELSGGILDEIAKRRPLSVRERADNLLRYLDYKSDVLGTCITFSTIDEAQDLESAHYLLAWTASRQLSELVTLADYCSEEGWVRHRITHLAGLPRELMLKPSGYTRLAELAHINPKSNQAFVAMWFDDQMDDAYERGIEPAIRKAGYEPQRIDKKEHNNKIDDQIIAEIRRSRFLVADFTQGETGTRGGVYYEAGYAQGIKIPVIFTCREDAIGYVHFDTRQYNHITWKTPEELLERLAQRISATIGDGHLKNS